MAEVGTGGLKLSLGASMLALVGAGGTLVCCVLPAVMVSLGLGAVLAGWVSAAPQLIWLSRHKLEVFGGAALMLALAGALLWWARSLPCPLDPRLAAACNGLRWWSALIWGIAAALYVLGAWFAFGWG